MPIEPNPFEDDLGAALRRTADGFQPDDSLGLVAGGHAHGRKLRRRRNATITAGVAAFALIGVGGALVGGLAKGGGGSGSSGVAAAPKKPVASASPATPPSAVRTSTPPPMTAKQVTDLFVSMLPKGHVTRQPGRGTEEGIPLASVVFNDGKGPGLVEIGIGYDQGAPSCPETDPPGTSCTSSHVPGGTLTIQKGYEYPDHRAETKDWYATLLTPSGALIGLSEWNSKQEKGAPISRPNPPLNSAQLTKIVTDPRWQRVIAALPDPQSPGGGKANG